MKNCMYKFLLTVCLGLGISFTNQSFASHLSGSEISYACTATPNIYLVTLKLFTECSSIQMCSCPLGSTTICNKSIDISSSGGGHGSQSLNLLVSQSGFDIVQLCSSSKTICNNCSSRTPGTFAPGMEVYTFQGLVNLTSIPASYCMITLSYKSCCRGNAANNIANPTSVEYYTYATINRCASPCNSSPVFNTPIDFVVCAGVDTKISIHANDPDGDSLSYHFANPLTSGGVSPPYVSPYSPTYLFPYLGAPALSPPAVLPNGLNLNPLTGDLSFRPMGVFCTNLTFEVKQWKTDTGMPVLMGTNRLEYYMYSQNCPSNSAVGLKKYDSIGTFLGTYGFYGDSIRINENERFCRIFAASDSVISDTTDIIASNISNMPGATFVRLYNSAIRSTNGPRQDSVKFCWTPPLLSGRSQPYIFVLTAKDRFCPLPAKSLRSIAIYVNQSINHFITVVTARNVSCFGGSNGMVFLVASGASGPVEFKKDNGTYQSSGVFNNLPAGSYLFTAKDSLNNLDSLRITISEAPAFIKSMNATHAKCLGSNDGSASILISGGTPPYQYSWNTVPVQNTPAVFNLHPGYAVVSVTDSNACMLKDSVLINYKPIYNGQEICAVTVDTISGLSQIVWNKTNGVGVAIFRVYKSTSVAGPFSLLNSTLFTNQSSVIDLTNPVSQATYYLIKSVDSCGNESTASGIHRPIKGSATSLGNGINAIFWYPYAGSNSANSQFILRSVNGGPFVILSQLSLGENSFYDSLAPAGTIRYLIELTQSMNCTPGTGSNIRILSNVMIALPSGIIEADETSSFEVYPNPATVGSITIITVKQGLYIESVDVINMLGSTVKRQNVNGLNQQTNIDVSEFADGVYNLIVKSNKGVMVPIKVMLNRGN